jgi:GNAT superfamily N-acetyltransferase
MVRRTSSRQQPTGVAGYSFPVIAIRPAAEADAPALASTAVAAYQHYVPSIGQLPAPMTADYTAAIRRGKAWVAAVAGFIILLSRPGYLLLENVAVLPTVQGRGIGARLLALAEDRARALHVPEIRLYTNAAMTENLAYYPRHGYTETHRSQQAGFHRVFFRKRVDT